MATDEWYRSSAWEADERVAFEARLKRARDDNRPQYLMIRAAALLESGHEADAVSFLQRVLHEYPQDLFAASCAEQLGDHYLATGDPLAAERHYRQSLTLKPDQNATTGEVHIGLAEALVAQRRFDAALADAALGMGEAQIAHDAATRALALLDAPDQFSRHAGVGRAVLTNARRRRLQAIARGDEPGRSSWRWSLRRR